MAPLADFLANLGAASVTWFWVPLTAWTILWLLSESFLNSNRIHPGIRYRLAQATLFALPAGIAFGVMYRFQPVSPPATTSAEPGIVVESGFVFEPLVMIAAPESVSSGLSVWAIVGIAFILAVAIAGTGVVRFFHSRRGLIGIRRSSREQSGVLPEEDLRTITERMGIRRTVRVVAHPKAPVPMTFGWRHPVIVLPEQLSGEQRHMALMHELVHIRRHDYVTNLLELLTTGIFGIHPGVIRIRRACALLRELSCDAVLIANHRIPRRDYADLLLLCVDPRRRTHRLAVSMADRPSHIHHRIEAMKSSRMLTQTTRRIGIAGVLLVFITGMALISSSFSVAAVDVSALSQATLFDDQADPGYGILERLPEPENGWEEFMHRVNQTDVDFGTVPVSNMLTLTIDSEGVPQNVRSMIQPGDDLRINIPGASEEYLEAYREALHRMGDVGIAALRETRFIPAQAGGEPVTAEFWLSFRHIPEEGIKVSAFMPMGDVAVTTELMDQHGEDIHAARATIAPDEFRTTRSPGQVRQPTAVDTVIFEVVEQEPVPIGGLEGIMQRLVYPETAYRAGIEGRVFVQFVVPPDGVPQNIQIIRSLCTECDEAAIRAIQETRFEPGRVRGQAVHVRYSIPITFRLSEEPVEDPPPPPPPPAPPPSGEMIFEVVEQPPVPIGGFNGIRERLVYPETAYRAGIEGRVFLTFVVGQDGVARDIEVTQSLCTECDEAAIKAVQETRFEPGRQRGHPVSVQITVPISFWLSGDDPPPPPPVPPQADDEVRPPPPPIEPPPSRP